MNKNKKEKKIEIYIILKKETRRLPQNETL